MPCKPDLTLLIGLVAIVLAISIYLNTLAFNDFESANHKCQDTKVTDCFKTHNLTKIANGVLGLQRVFHTLFFIGVIALVLKVSDRPREGHDASLAKSSEDCYIRLVFCAMALWACFLFLQELLQQNLYPSLAILDGLSSSIVLVSAYSAISLFLLCGDVKKDC
ncbi:MAG: hypothetical protein KAW41_06285 [Candidatus Diapherotrites archaeon]|nr:hypothetical protein [Candidatus Diapherotrites archaeon]